MVIGIHKTTEPFEFDESRWFGYEKPAVLEAFRVLAKEGYYISISGHDYNEREKRLKKEYEENPKSPGPGEEQPEEKKGIIYPTTFPKADFYYKHVLNEGNPALKEAASQFNDALLDEQAKKIEKLAKENERLKDQIAVLDACKKYNDKIDRKQIKYLGKEIAKLNGIIHDKNEELKRKTKGCCELVAETVDLKEVLRKTESLLHDTREANSKNLDTCFKNEDIIDDLKKNLAERTKLAKKYGKELEDSSLELCKLDKQLKDKDAVLSDVAEELRLSKIREKNLTEVCQKYMKENEDLKEKLAGKVVDKIDAQALKSAESAPAYKEKVIAEKDEVIADLGKELADSKKMVEWVRNASKEYCDYGVAANEFIKELAGLYVLANNSRIINDEMLERCKNYQTYGFPANCNRETKKEINDIASGKTKAVGVDKAEEGGDHSAIIVQCYKDITTISKDEAEIIERCTKNGTELHYSEKDGFTYTNMYGEEMPIRCLRGIFAICTDEEYKSLFKK